MTIVHDIFPWLCSPGSEHEVTAHSENLVTSASCILLGLDSHIVHRDDWVFVQAYDWSNLTFVLQKVM